MSRGRPGRKGPDDLTMFDSCWYTFGCGGSVILAAAAAVAAVVCAARRHG